VAMVIVFLKVELRSRMERQSILDRRHDIMSVVRIWMAECGAKVEGDWKQKTEVFYLCFLFQAMMDRERKDELPQMQVGFIDVICLPLYKVSLKYCSGHLKIMTWLRSSHNIHKKALKFLYILGAH
jgi:hypothetical protein